MAVKHTKVLTGPDGTNTNRAQPTDWNADHAITGDVDMGAYDLKTDDIVESVADAGVTIDGVLLKDTSVNFGGEDLDSYDEGLWTPAVSFALPGDIAAAYTWQVGTYTRVGRLVTAFMTLQTATFTHTTASGTFLVTGLPFTSAASSGYPSQGSLALMTWTFAGLSGLTLELVGNSTQMYIRGLRSGSSFTTLQHTHVTTGSVIRLGGTISYEV